MLNIKKCNYNYIYITFRTKKKTCLLTNKKSGIDKILASYIRITLCFELLKTINLKAIVSSIIITELLNGMEKMS